MKTAGYLLVTLCFCIINRPVLSQEEHDKSATIALYTGALNYQGDLNPSSFTFRHSNFATGIIIRKPLSRWFTARIGALTGKIEASDSWNREYLKPRNLSFTTTIKEVYLGLEVTLFNEATSRFIPYFYGGIAVFQFNPWANDNAGKKTYLKPLSTEGQGLPDYPEQKPYALTQLALPFGAGARYAVSDGLSIGIDFSQRKSFTDYIDDVSSHFIDGSVLMQAKGPKAVEMSYRGDEIPGGRTIYPDEGEKRGTPSEMDWYYFFGLTLEMKLNKIGGIMNLFQGGKSVASQRCPRIAY